MELNAITSQSIDVLIIGAGPIGLAAALWFGQEGFRVVLIEQYAELPGKEKRTFNQRHQQVGLDPTSLAFLRKINSAVADEICRQGCPHGDWINIAILRLQNILHAKIMQLSNVTRIFTCRLEAVTKPDPNKNARVILSRGEKIFSVCPELIVVCDGKHDGSGVAKEFFNFPPASRVTLSSLGIIGMMCRLDQPEHICLTNYSSDRCETSIGIMHVRLLGSLQERYIALGAADEAVKEQLEQLSPKEISDLLKTTFHQLKDPNEPECNKFTEVSTRPISIVLDYRKETIKLLDGSNTIVTVEGDAARKTTFFSGSGLNSGYQGLDNLFTFCQDHKRLIFNSTNLLDIDQILLQKDRDSLEISLNLLKKGIKFVLTPQEIESCLSIEKV